MHFSVKRGFMCNEKSFSPSVGSFENAKLAKDRKTIKSKIFTLN